MFGEFEKAGGNAFATKQKLADDIIAMLTTHTYLENECMYPRVRELVPEVEDDILESYEEHHVADVLCMELAAMSSDDERLHAEDDGADGERAAPHRRGGGASGSRPSARSSDVRNCRRSVSGCWRCGPPRRVARPSPARSRRHSTPFSVDQRTSVLRRRPGPPGRRRPDGRSGHA